MERKVQTNPVNGRNYVERDFTLGQTVFLAGFKFILVKADEYTEKYMEDNVDVFPRASVDFLLSKIKLGAKNFASLQDYAVYLIKTLDKDNNGFVDIQEFSAGLKAMNIFISKPEEHTLMRRFDVNGDSKISIEEFYNTLAASL